MKVALVSSLYEPLGYGGAERVAQDVAEGLAALGHELHVITLGRDAEAMEQRNGVQVHRLRLRNLYWPFPVARAGFPAKVAWHAVDAYNPAMGRELGRLLDRLRPEVVNTHNLAGFSAAAWREAARRGLPLVHTLHDHYLLCSYSTMFRDGRNCASPCLRCRAASAPRRALARHVDAVIGVSRYILERHRAAGLFARAHASVVAAALPPAAPRAEADAGPRALRIGFLGGLVPAKGADRLLEAYLALPAGKAELHVAGGGDPEFEAALRRRAGGRADVRWHGVVRSDEFLPALDLLVVPSRVHEAMGRVVLEAFRHGLPVVAARRGGLPELVPEAAGWLYEPDDGAQLPKILREIVAQPALLGERRAAARATGARADPRTVPEGYLAAYRAASDAAARAAIASR